MVYLENVPEKGLDWFCKPDVVHQDGTFWEASWPVTPGGTALWAVGLLDQSKRYYFREVRQSPRWRWWAPWRRKWLRTGRAVEGGMGLWDKGFRVSG